jgi:transcriptional regulator with XRE-family HTH domain
MKTVNSELGNRIRQYRKRAGLSQEKLALNAGITVSFLGDIERGHKKPSVESLEKLLTALNVSFVEFFDYETDIRPPKDSSAHERLKLLLKWRPADEVEMIYAVAKRILEYNDSQAPNNTP